MKIVTDSASDLPPSEANSLGVRVAPLTIHFPEGEVKSEDISPDDFYNRLRQMVPSTPTTSQPSSGVFADIYRELAKNDEEILSIHISSGLSGTIESARAAAQQVPEAKVTMVDTLTLSGAERFQVLAAVMAVKAGWSKQAILERLKEIRLATELIYTLETLSYLRRGGRIGRVQALAGALLKIKPVIYVDKSDGKYDSLGKGRTLTKTMEIILDHLSKTYGKTPVWVSIMHGQFEDQAQIFSGLLSERLDIAKKEILRISPVLGVHTGPGVVGAAVLPYKLMADLFG